VDVERRPLPDAVRRLEAGHSLRLTPPEPLPANEVGSALAEPADVSVAKPPEPRVQGTARPAPVPTPERHDADGPARRLWAGADRARRAGEPTTAARLLERLIHEHPESSQAALGAFTLGAVYADELQQAEHAARAFRQALQLGLPAALRDGCYLRWAASARAAGDVTGVRHAVEDYAKKYPSGEQLPALQALLGRATRAR